MFTEGIFPIGDGLLDVDEELLKGLLMPNDINEIYDVEQTPFARGKFAAVRRAIHKNSGVHFAAKFLKRRRRAQSSDKEIKHEIAVLMLCDGAENIVKLNAVHESRSDTALLLELATGGELQAFLDNEECLSEAHARYCMREVLKALQFLHKRSIAHLDLKPQNILLTGEHIEDGLKLCDFGISRVVAEGTNVREIVGTPDYVAPEVLQYEPLSLLTDIWSVGVLAYVLLTGFSPFGGETKQETFLNISQCALTFPDKMFAGVSSAAIDFIRRALRIKPNDRMTAAGCLEHIWLKDECAIDRQIFNNISKKTTTDIDSDEVEDEDDDDDDDVDNVEEDEEEDDEEEDEVEQNAGVVGCNGKHVATELEENVILLSENNAINNGTNMDSSDNELENHSYHRNNQYSESNNETHKYNGTTKTTMAVHTMPAATRATTIPLTNMQQPQQYQQQQQHQQDMIARRHSTDSNKENTYMATKQISPPIAATSTTTIIIPSSDLSSNHSSLTSSNQIEINGINGPKSIQSQCLFPDAPTTPKVIRKAPTTDTSPTSVKALVKKFQLEGNNADKNHLKECLQHQQQQQQHQHQHQQQQHITGRKSTTAIPATATTTVVNGKLCVKITSDKCTNGIDGTKKKYAHQTNGIMSCNGSTGNNRRASEPLVVVHKKSTPSTSTSNSAPASNPTSSFKTTCVYCLTCGATNNITTNGNNTTSTTTGCRHSAATTDNTSSNNIVNSNSAISITSNGSNISNASSTAILLSSSSSSNNHHHHHHLHHSHHHHHHHHVAKTAANNLSLDQGIIC